MRVLDLFSGIGGFSLGLGWAGMTTVGFCEIDPFCREVLAKHWPEVPCHDDVETREFTEGEADIICGGFPCQDISLAGDGAGLAGARSGLYRHLVRAIRLVRPLYAIVENVAALLGRGMGTVLGDLAEIGYDAEWHCIPASAVGAPHRRDRVWLVAHPNGEPGRQQQRQRSRPGEGARDQSPGRGAAANPDAYSDGQQGREEHDLGPETGVEAPRRHDAIGLRSPVADADSARLEELFAWKPGERPTSERAHCWAAEPDVGRMAYGVPARVDRLRGLGNAVVPQIPEMIGRAILAAAH